jgi:hypothetical protein
MKYTDDVLKKVQEVELSILDDFIKICEENNLKYFTVSGTGLTGSIEDFGNCKSLGYINVAGTQVTGSLANLAAAMASNGRTSGTLIYTDKNGVSSSVNFPYNP